MSDAAASDLTAEFTIEPFEEGRPGPHVVKAIEAARASGVEVSVGPFGTRVQGNKDEIVSAVAAALDAGLSEGASHVTVTVTNAAAIEESAFAHPFLNALRPLLEAVGADPILPELLSRTDVPIEWEGEVIGGIRLRSLEGAVSRMADQIAGELGGELSTLSREEKQQVVRMLNERGAFLIRGAVEEVAELMGVSRITIYNYLNATRREPIVSAAD